MPWNSSTKIMTAPLNINKGGDIQQAVNYNSGDLGDCIVNGTINKWAKWKPERNSSPAPLTLEERKEDNWGLKLTKFTNMSDLISGYTGEWKYLRPRGASYDERFRFYDFLNTAITSNGYNKNASCFFRRSASTFATSYILGQGGLRFIAQWEPESQLESSRPGCVKRSEIRIDPLSEAAGTLADTYFGVIMYSTYWDAPKIKTSSSVVGSNTYSSEVSFSDSELQNFPSSVSVYPIFSVSAITSLQNSFPHAGVFALPMSPFSLEVRGAETATQIVVPTAAATFARAALNISMIVELYSTVITDIGPLSIDIYRATSMDDKTGAQIGATDWIYGVTTTESQQYTNSYRISRPDYIRVVITGSVSATTQITADFNLAVTLDDDAPLEEL